MTATVTGRAIVPYIASWTGEESDAAPPMMTADGIGYADERPTDRDVDSVSWALCGGTTTGGPDDDVELHPERQRTTTEDLFRAGCKKPAGRDERGTHPRPGSPAPNVLVLDRAPDLPFVVAHQAVCELHRITVVGFAAATP